MSRVAMRCATCSGWWIGASTTPTPSYELRPGDLRMDPAAEPAIGRGDDPLAADQLGETQNAVGDQLGMFDDIGGVADDAGQDQLVVGQLDLLPDPPFVLVPHIA